MLVSSMRLAPHCCWSTPGARWPPHSAEPTLYADSDCVSHSFVRRKIVRCWLKSGAPVRVAGISFFWFFDTNCTCIVYRRHSCRKGVTRNCSCGAACLIGQAREAFLLTEHLQHFENSRRGRATR